MTLVNKLHNYWKVLFYFYLLIYLFFEVIISLLSYGKNSLKQSKVVYIQTCVIMNSQRNYRKVSFILLFTTSQFMLWLLSYKTIIVLWGDYFPLQLWHWLSNGKNTLNQLKGGVPTNTLLRTPMTLVKKRNVITKRYSQLTSTSGQFIL